MPSGSGIQTYRAVTLCPPHGPSLGHPVGANKVTRVGGRTTGSADPGMSALGWCCSLQSCADTWDKGCLHCHSDPARPGVRTVSGGQAHGRGPLPTMWSPRGRP